ncbi:MAG: TRAP transporter small permease subunit [Phreatobacter sp.]|uniref:TRAP transporter small permease subunit n=1 Tax=Phreatobacter sp. TaxID=1966341 RepID=UPI001A4F04CA|nr:TRAP transporter small permease subunit [Phreatobacter sp.]MBL8570049.1 TRAP transporter small permease subunit [Phreatobacter sp.]
MGGLLAFSRAVDALNAAFGRIADWCVLLACLISAGNATTRYLIHVSSNSMLEIQWYLFGMMVLLGASYTLRMNEHVRVDLVYGAVSDRKRLWIDAIGMVFFLLPVTVYMTYLSWPFFLTSFKQWEGSQNAGGLLVWPIKLVMPLGFALLTLQGLSELIKRVAALRGLITFESKYEKPLQ